MDMNEDVAIGSTDMSGVGKAVTFGSTDYDTTGVSEEVTVGSSNSVSN